MGCDYEEGPLNLSEPMGAKTPQVLQLRSDAKLCRTLMQ